jgi:hypothetical protein
MNEPHTKDKKIASELSNREFLRASNIRVEIDYDIESNFDQIVELINGADELNYTGSRLDTRKQIKEFRNELEEFGYHAGCVRVFDNHADYGLAGFFQMRQKAMDRRLVHFVFSCRVMNMGVEQYVYRLLGRPEHETDSHVLPALDETVAPDWINESSGGGTVSDSRSGKVVLLGGCDLLQVGNYCGTDRLEFVNRADGDAKVRYDDFGFLLSSRTSLPNCDAIRAVPCWQCEDALRFDAGLSQASLVILSLLQAVNGSYYDAGGGVWLRLPEKKNIRRIRKRDPEWFDANFRDMELDFEARIKLNAEALEAVSRRVPEHCNVFVVGGYTRGEFKENILSKRYAFNASVREFCASHSNQFSYVDLDTLILPEDAFSHLHFTRKTYFAMARHILDTSERLAQNKSSRHAADARNA